MFGFGRATGLMYFGWVMKLWGSDVLETTRTLDCGLANYITGWVTMT